MDDARAARKGRFGILRRALVAATILAALGGCSLFNEKKGLPPCPDVSVLADASKFTTFRPGEGRDITDIVLQGEITGFRGSCAYDKDKKQLTLSLQVEMSFTRGPAASGRTAHAAYFIAVPSYFPKPQAKQVMEIPFQFDNESDHARITDNAVDVIFPVKDLAKDLDKFEVYVGFQLDQAQLDFNRRSKAQ